ncbi:hypothetical protein DL1_07585 [Thioclava dalianensis]|uniref:Pilus assembly protein TadE n=1 Tax=Thioclava dalianensis TaxID=1185766 RepID=A0A074TR67_9RHOB|nr:hypothetical protein [Thioclava dalianensis]KEP71463.1 hypothetical protein DL1_07585 [Thioclava dalianensis]SFM79987.1 hypothetical protein SAMN05216224_101364 [Thioclava dalianensis]
MSSQIYPSETPPAARMRAAFRHDEEGAVTIPSLIWLVFYFFLMFSAVEMSVMMIKQTLLDRGVAMTARVMQIGISRKPDEAVLKKSICDNVAFIGDCMQNLTVETFSVDQADWTSTLSGHPLNCESSSDNTEDTPPTDPNLEYGTDDELMLMRVCLRVKPMMQDNFISKALTAAWPWGDRYALVVTTAFVNEPRVSSAGSGT